MNINPVSSVLPPSLTGSQEAKQSKSPNEFSSAQPVVDHKALEALLKNSEQISKHPNGTLLFTVHPNGVAMVSKRTDVNQPASATPKDGQVRSGAGRSACPFMGLSGNRLHDRYLQTLDEAKNLDALSQAIGRIREEGLRSAVEKLWTNHKGGSADVRVSESGQRPKGEIVKDTQGNLNILSVPDPFRRA